MARKHVYQIEITTNYTWGEPLKLYELMAFVAEKGNQDVRRLEVKKLQKNK